MNWDDDVADIDDGAISKLAANGDGGGNTCETGRPEELLAVSLWLNEGASLPNLHRTNSIPILVTMRCIALTNKLVPRAEESLAKFAIAWSQSGELPFANRIQVSIKLDLTCCNASLNTYGEKSPVLKEGKRKCERERQRQQTRANVGCYRTFS